MLVLSETLIASGLNPRRPKEIRHPNGRTGIVTFGAIASHRPLLALRKRMIDNLLDDALVGLGIGAGIAAALHYAGGRLKRRRRLRGGELVSAKQLRRRVVLAAPDRDTAEWSAESLGRAEVEEMAESVNCGVEIPRDGVTLGARRALRPLVLPAEVARLDSLAGYLKFPGAWPVARTGLKYRKRPQVAERFVPWESKEWAVGTESTEHDAVRPSTRTTERTPDKREERGTLRCR